MFDILKQEFNLGWLDASGVQPYVGLGFITQEQFDEITGANAAQQAQSTAAQSAAPSAQPSSVAPSNSANNPTTQA